LEQGGVFEKLNESDVIKTYVRRAQQCGAKLAGSVQALLGGEAEVSTSGAPFVEINALTNDAVPRVGLPEFLPFNHCAAFELHLKQNRKTFLSYALDRDATV